MNGTSKCQAACWVLPRTHGRGGARRGPATCPAAVLAVFTRPWFVALLVLLSGGAVDAALSQARTAFPFLAALAAFRRLAGRPSMGRGDGRRRFRGSSVARRRES